MDEFEVLIYDLGYHNKIHVNIILDYPAKNDTYSKIPSIEKIKNIIFENNIEDDIIS